MIDKYLLLTQNFCIANTVKQLLVHPNIATKRTIIKKRMSTIPKFENLADDIYKQIKPNQFIEA
jgi:hypothetical protein